MLKRKMEVKAEMERQSLYSVEWEDSAAAAGYVFALRTPSVGFFGVFPDYLCSSPLLEALRPLAGRTRTIPSRVK